MVWKSSLAAIACFALVSAVKIPSFHVVHEERDAAPKRWVKRDRVLPNSIFPVRIGLAQANLHTGHDHLIDVSDPDSPNYGKHWTSQQVIDHFKPSEATVDAVRDWLRNGGIPDSSITHSDNKGWFAFDATAEQMESLLHAEYHEYEDTISGGILPSCDRYHVPASIREHIDYVTPGLKLIAPNQRAKRARRTRSEPAARRDMGPSLTTRQDPDFTCYQEIQPTCITGLYKIPPARTKVNSSNVLGIYETAIEQCDQTDLNLFFEAFAPQIPQGTHPIDRDIDGAVANISDYNESGGEVMLDLCIAYPIIYPQQISVFNENDLHYQSWANTSSLYGFNQLLDAIDGSYCTYSAYGETGDAKGIDPSYPDYTPNTGYPHKLQCGVYKPTNVISVSWGGQEADVPIAYQKRQCNEYMKLGLQGVSFLFGAGDTGVGGTAGENGGYDGTTGCLGPKQDIFNPYWPSTCPYVTSVGGTQLYPNQTVNGQPQPEAVVFDPDPSDVLYNLSGGGGFSNIFPMPSYQKTAVQNYFANHNPPYPYYSQLAPNASNPVKVNITHLQGETGGLYNRLGRAYPDVAANAMNVIFWWQHFESGAGGTSCATPIFASIVNRIVEERLAAGKRPLGFLNPTLYKNPSVLNDVTNGSNPGCFVDGFSAAHGWDPASGLGTPIYPKMLDLFMSLP